MSRISRTFDYFVQAWFPYLSCDVAVESGAEPDVTFYMQGNLPECMFTSSRQNLYAKYEGVNNRSRSSSFPGRIASEFGRDRDSNSKLMWNASHAWSHSCTYSLEVSYIFLSLLHSKQQKLFLASIILPWKACTEYLFHDVQMHFSQIFSGTDWSHFLFRNLFSAYSLAVRSS